MRRRVPMTDQTGFPAAATIEQCVDEIDDFIETLERYPESVIAMALRVHLGALLRAMVDEQLCSLQEVREFVAALEQEAIGAAEKKAPAATADGPIVKTAAALQYAVSALLHPENRLMTVTPNIGPNVEVVIIPPVHDLGDGFNVRRALPSSQRRMVGPFVFFDQMGPTILRAGSGLDVRPQPHIGLTTVTYLFDGEIIHRDSLGTVQAIRPGAVNWMIAGRGIVHSERTAADKRSAGSSLSGIQTWIALPKAEEEHAPSFRHYVASELPLIDGEGVTLRLIAGSLFGKRSPVETLSEMFYADATLAANARLLIDAEHEQRALYVIRGRIDIDGDSFDASQLVVLRPGQAITVLALGPVQLLLLGGAALDGPRHVWWNFVSSSSERIEQAKQDWRDGRLGHVPGDAEFIPLPAVPAVQTPPVNYP